MLRDDAMIVRLSISQWTARKCDSAVSAETASRYNADLDSGRWNKLLVAKEAIQAITQAVSAARTFHYENTLPWDDGGGRLLPSKNFPTYSKKMRVLREKFEHAVREFLENYDVYRKDAELKLNGMFNSADYPGRGEIEGKFSFGTDIEPVPCAEDFRISLQSSDMARLKSGLDARVKERLLEATRELYLRLNEVVGKLAEKLSDREAIFRDSLIENVIELVNLLPRLNVTGDPKLEALRIETKTKLLAIEPDSLRKDEHVRAKAAKDAKAILDKMSSYFKT